MSSPSESHNSSTPNADHSDGITIVFPTYGGEQWGIFRAKAGATLKEYLRGAELKPHGLMTQALFGGVHDRDRQKVKMTDVLQPGAVVIIGMPRKKM